MQVPSDDPREVFNFMNKLEFGPGIAMDAGDVHVKHLPSSFSSSLFRALPGSVPKLMRVFQGVSAPLPSFKRPSSPSGLPTPPFKIPRVAPSAAGAPGQPVVMGPLDSRDRGSLADNTIILSLKTKIEELQGRMEARESSASQQGREEDDLSADETEKPAMRRRLREFRRFATDTLPDYIPQPDPETQGSLGLAASAIDGDFDRSCHVRAVDRAIESALPLSKLLLNAQKHLDKAIQGRDEAEELQDISTPLAKLSLGKGGVSEVTKRRFRLAFPKI